MAFGSGVIRNMDRLRPETRSRVGIGVVGPHDLVEQIVMVAADLPAAADWRLVGAPHAGEHETYEKFSRIADSIDVVLFTGPLQHDLARQAGELPVPATHIPMSGAALYASLLRGVLTHGVDPARVSIDSLPAADVDEAYDEIGVDTAGVHLSEYDEPESVRGFVGFHEQLYRQGATTAALTTIKERRQGTEHHRRARPADDADHAHPAPGPQHRRPARHRQQAGGGADRHRRGRARHLRPAQLFGAR